MSSFWRRSQDTMLVRRSHIDAASPAPSDAAAANPAPSERLARATPRRLDPRWFQIAMLSALLVYGVVALDFDLGLARIAGVLGACLLTQYVCGRLTSAPGFEWKSAVISAIGLCTLLRANSAWLLFGAAAVAIASKFVIRWRGKHLFNPTNFVLVLMLWTGWGWVSPGQYGHFAFAALLILCMGMTVVNRAARSDVSLAFLAGYAAILFGRSLWLGEPMSIPIHRLQSGLLLQFTFNMISDPKTTPDSRAGRILFGVLVALGAGYVQFRLFRTNGPIWSLAAVSLLVPLIDRLLPGRRYHWTRPTAGSPAPAPARTELPEGATHEIRVLVPAVVRLPRA
jgi:hypothetical protein